MSTKLKPATVTLDRAARWFRLLDEVGVSDLYDTDARREAPSAKPESPAEAFSRKDAPTPVTFNLGALFRRISTGGLLEDLARIVFEVEEDSDLASLTIDELEAALVPFVERSTAPLRMLTGLGFASQGGAGAGGDGQASSVPTPSETTGPDSL